MDAKEMHEAVLAHHGILGMKWGVRRYQNKDGSLTRAGKKRLAKEEQKERAAAKQAAKADVKNRRLLSDEDLKKKIDRLKLERELKSLTEEDIAPGKKAVKDVLGSVGKKTGTAILTGAVLYAAKTAANTKGANEKELKPLREALKSATTPEAKKIAKEAIESFMKSDKKKTFAEMFDWNELSTHFKLKDK
jgi:hypothetical protein